MEMKIKRNKIVKRQKHILPFLDHHESIESNPIIGLLPSIRKGNFYCLNCMVRSNIIQSSFKWLLPSPPPSSIIHQNIAKIPSNLILRSSKDQVRDLIDGLTSWNSRVRCPNIVFQSNTPKTFKLYLF